MRGLPRQRAPVRSGCCRDRLDEIGDHIEHARAGAFETLMP
jgi:hypothetical protein